MVLAAGIVARIAELDEHLQHIEAQRNTLTRHEAAADRSIEFRGVDVMTPVHPRKALIKVVGAVHVKLRHNSEIPALHPAHHSLSGARLSSQ